MKTVEKWCWRTLWAGRMLPGKIHYTEDEIKRVHPEAERIDCTRILVDEPETQAELDAQHQAMTRSPRSFRPEPDEDQ